MSLHTAPEKLQHVTIPLSLVIPRQKQHYFTPDAEPVAYTRRTFDFWGETALIPLVHAFLEGCAADQNAEYRYLFTLLGGELATNAIQHSRSGAPGGSYTLRIDRAPTGLTLTCRDAGIPNTARLGGQRHHLTAPRQDNDLLAEAGRGLALVDALATTWGDNGFATHRHVWFFLAYDLTESAWSAA